MRRTKNTSGYERRAYFRVQVRAVADRVLDQGIVNNREVMMIDRLELKNFTSFGDLDIDFSPKINVIIGENGTGKTQLLKALYFANKSLALQDATSEEMLRLYRQNLLMRVAERNITVRLFGEWLERTVVLI